jgi:hypothetical protein
MSVAGARRAVGILLSAVPLSRIPLTLEHYYDFGPDRERVGQELKTPAAWDAIRDLPGPFGLPETRDLWELAAAEGDFVDRAAAIAAVAERLGARSIASYGVGAAFVELNLASLRPDLELICADYAPRTLARLAELFPEARVVRHNLLTDAPVVADLHLFHRIDSELSNREWHRVFPRYREPILLVATELLEAGTVVRELRARVTGSASRAGYIRTEAGLRSLWRATHRAERRQISEHVGFLLRSKSMGIVAP